jgi:hypothetical protein
MGLYTGKHLKTFHIIDGVKKINYAHINRIVIPSNSYIYCDLSRGPINRLLWTNYSREAFTEYTYHCTYTAEHHSRVKHTHIDNALSVTKNTPEGIDIPASTGSGHLH